MRCGDRAIIAIVARDRPLGIRRITGDRLWQALAQPKEGTILTVITAFARRVGDLAGSMDDFVPLMQEGLAAAEGALAGTRSSLPVLREAGVVDAGALGFVRFVEGIVDYTAAGRMGEVALVGATPPVGRANVNYDPTAISFRYCTECVGRGDGDGREGDPTSVADVGGLRGRGRLP